MLLRALISFFSLGLVTSSTFPEVASYAKISRNGQVSRGDGGGGRSFSSISSTPSRSNASSRVNEGRNFQDIDITVSPIYIPPKIPKLKSGEAVDFPVTQRYSTIDEEMLTKLESARKKPEIQARFHPPASFEHSVANANAVRQQQQQQQQKPQTINVVPDTPKYPGPIYTGFNYKVPGFHSSKESDFSDKPISKPISIDEYESSNVRTKPADPYKTVSTNYGYAEFGPEPAGPAGEASPKPIYSDHEDQLALVDGPYLDHDFHGDHDLIYEHVPEYPEYHHHHHHHQQQQTTEMPEMNDQRLDKRPYSYYFIGKKLWYVPLYFSIYFIIYIAALVLKSVARHKINFPANLAEAAHARSSADDLGWWEFTGRILQGIESFAERLARDS